MKKLRKYRSPADGARIGVRVYPDIDERMPVIGCSSEVMMHFGLAGEPIEVSLVQDRYINGEKVPVGEGRLVAQVWKDGREFSAPILTGEAGFYCDGDDYYCYPDVSRLSSHVKYLLMLRPPYPTEILEAP
jgi:hypothetical protein